MPYIPRFTTAGINGNPYWYNKNPYYAIGEGLPRTECYAWGRFWECSDINKHFENRPHLGVLDAYQWYGNSIDGYTRNQTWELGAVACFDYVDHNVLKGAVAIVEEVVYGDPYYGDIIICMPGTSDPNVPGDLLQWILQLSNNDIIDVYPYNYSDMTFQGYIHNPITGGSLDPPINFKPWFAKTMLYKKREQI